MDVAIVDHRPKLHAKRYFAAVFVNAPAQRLLASIRDRR